MFKNLGSDVYTGHGVHTVEYTVIKTSAVCELEGETEVWPHKKNKRVKVRRKLATYTYTIPKAVWETF
jgi:hypothetical protein